MPRSGPANLQNLRRNARRFTTVGVVAIKTIRRCVASSHGHTRENTGGRVLSSKSFNSGNQGAQIHQIRLLVDGERVITVVVDAQGRVRRR